MVLPGQVAQIFQGRQDAGFVPGYMSTIGKKVTDDFPGCLEPW